FATEGVEEVGEIADCEGNGDEPPHEADAEADSPGGGVGGGEVEGWVERRDEEVRIDAASGGGQHAGDESGRAEEGGQLAIPAERGEEDEEADEDEEGKYPGPGAGEEVLVEQGT